MAQRLKIDGVVVDAALQPLPNGKTRVVYSTGNSVLQTIYVGNTDLEKMKVAEPAVAEPVQDETMVDEKIVPAKGKKK